MADLADLGVVSAAERGAELILKHPATGAELDLALDVMGFDAEPVVQAAREFDRAEAKKTPDEREQDEGSPVTRRNAALAVAAVTGWRNLQVKGKDVKFSAAKAREILSDPNYVWIVAQVCQFGGRRANFFPKASGG